MGVMCTMILSCVMSFVVNQQKSRNAYGTAVRVEGVSFIEILLYHIYVLISSLELQTIHQESYQAKHHDQLSNTACFHITTGLGLLSCPDLMCNMAMFCGGISWQFHF